jgi:hypothetical protein
LDLRSANLLFRTIIKMLQLKESHIKVFFFMLVKRTMIE